MKNDYVKVQYNNNNTHLTDIITITLPSILTGHGEYRSHSGMPISCPTYSIIIMIPPGVTHVNDVFRLGEIPKDHWGTRNLEYEMLKPHVELVLIRREIYEIKEILKKIVKNESL